MFGACRSAALGRFVVLASLWTVAAESGCASDAAPTSHSQPVLPVDDAGAAFCPQGASCWVGDISPNIDAGASVAPPATSLQPQFGAVKTASLPPPPISGGTLLITRDGKTAVVSDPDRDSIYVVDLGTLAVSSTIALRSGDEPGRVVEDGAGRAHVALRSGGALVTVDIARGRVLARQPVCPAPRGVAWDATTDVVWVACATGEVVALPARGGPTRTLVVERDLRDVIVDNGSLTITKFRSAETLSVGGDGRITSRAAIPAPANRVSHVAWRTVGGAPGTLVSVHQAESTTSLSTVVPGGYGSSGCGLPLGAPLLSPDGGAQGSCAGPAVLSVLTVSADGSPVLQRGLPGALVVDVAVSTDGSLVAAVAAGNAFASGLHNVFAFEQGGAGNGHLLWAGEQPIAVAFAADGRLFVQTREPAELWAVDLATERAGRAVVLSATSRDDSGHDLFHAQAGAMIACASCHPEGGDDGHVWLLDNARRRTPSLRGTIAGTAPYHWPGDQPDFGALVQDVYTRRMSGQALAPAQVDTLRSWVERIPAPAPPSWGDPSAVQRGSALFNSASIGCSRCHAGPKLTNNATVDVGTGGKFQVPPLVGVGWRTPLLHDGRAATVGDRFAEGATPEHGSIDSLSKRDISDLTAYLDHL